MLRIKDKKVVLLTDEETLDVISVLLVDKDVEIKSIIKDVRRVKDEMPSEWTTEDILNGISCEYTELPLNAVYI